MVDLAERCVERMKAHVARRMEEAKAELAPEAREAFERMTFEESEDRVRYWAEVERELVGVLRPVQEMIDGCSLRAAKWRLLPRVYGSREGRERLERTAAEMCEFVERQVQFIEEASNGQVRQEAAPSTEAVEG